MIQKILVVGSGSAGLLSALALRKKLSKTEVRIVRDPDLGVIGVGEGTTPNVPNFLFHYLGISRKAFYEMAEPTWKLGVRFLWGPRGRFDLTFAPQLDVRWGDLPQPHGFFCDEEFSCVNAPSALMEEGKACHRLANGMPDIQPWHAFHIENRKFVAMLEAIATAAGVEIIDGRVSDVERGGAGVAAVHLEDGRRLEADLFLDCSGFRSELLGKALQEPFESFGGTLFCDRAVVGGWERTDEPVLPYTTAEQMSTGWRWQIEHEQQVNCGYVYASDLISDDEAAAEFRRRNPKVPEDPRVVKFRSGCYRRTWVENVVAIGNSAGFVEPLEATALMVVCMRIQALADLLVHSELAPTPTFRELFNEHARESWCDIRDFLGLHYQLNTALDTPYWKRCREETDLSEIKPLFDFYRENGPTGFCRYRTRSTRNSFGIEGYLVMLVGQKAEYRKHHRVTPDELARWERHRQRNIAMAKQGLTVAEALACIRQPAWQWHGDRAMGPADC